MNMRNVAFSGMTNNEIALETSIHGGTERREVNDNTASERALPALGG